MLFFVSSFSHVNFSKAVCWTFIRVAHSVQLLPLNTADNGFESRVDKVFKFDFCFCSSHRIFCACSSLIRNMCSFVLVWTSVHFWTSVLLNLSVCPCIFCFCRFALPALRHPMAGLAPVIAACSYIFICAAINGFLSYGASLINDTCTTCKC